MGPGIWQLLIVALIVLMLFGTKRLRNMGSDLGTAIRGFRNSMKSGDTEGEQKPAVTDTPNTPSQSISHNDDDARIIDAESTPVKSKQDNA
jgi:sec-independent protein translocase protein TatA